MKKEEMAQNHIAVFSTRFYHILTCIYTVFSHDKAYILKFRTLAFFINVISKITNSGKINYFLVFVILEHLPYIKYMSTKSMKKVKVKMQAKSTLKEPSITYSRQHNRLLLLH